MIEQLYEPFRHWSDTGSVFVISDTHFNDDDCALMDPNWIVPEEHTDIFRKSIHKNDTVIHLGDVGDLSVWDAIWKPGKRPHEVLITGNHDEVRGVKVDRNTGGVQPVKELTEGDRTLRTGLDRKMRIQGVRVFSQLAAGILHDLIAGMAGIGGNHADVSRNNIGSELNGQIQDPLGFFDQLRVLFRVAEALPEIASESGDRQTVIRDSFLKLRSLFANQIFRAHFTFGSVYLQTLCTDGYSLVKRGRDVAAERIQNDTDRKLIHKSTSINRLCPETGVNAQNQDI